MLTNRQYAFARDLDGVRVIVTVNNDDNAASMSLAAGNAAEYIGTLTGEKVPVENGRIHVTVAGNSGNIWVPAGDMPEYKPVEMNVKMPENVAEADNVKEAIAAAADNSANTGNASEKVADSTSTNTVATAEPASEKSEVAVSEVNISETAVSEAAVDWSKSPEDMTVEELQACILAKMANNGPVTDQMKKTVYDNIWHDSLVNWLKSFR